MGIRDRITVGVISGITAALPWRLLNSWEYRKRITELQYGQLAAGLFVPKGAVNDPPANAIGRITNQLLLAGTGVATTYLLSATGKDSAMLKGAGVTSMLWLSLYGLSTRTEMTSAQPKRAWTPLLSFFDHVALGATTAFIITKMADPSLFPSRNQLALVSGLGRKGQNADEETNSTSRSEIGERA